MKYLIIIITVAIIILFLAQTLSLTTPRSEPVFIYATLKNPFIRFYACRCITSSTNATLTGYRKDGRTIILDGEALTEGRVIYVSQQELARLDKFERIPDVYRREQTNINDTYYWVYIKN